MAEFAFSARANCLPQNAGPEMLFALQDVLGFSRNVIVQASCQEAGNAATLNGTARSGVNGRHDRLFDPIRRLVITLSRPAPQGSRGLTPVTGLPRDLEP